MQTANASAQRVVHALARVQCDSSRDGGCGPAIWRVAVGDQFQGNATDHQPLPPVTGAGDFHRCLVPLVAGGCGNASRRRSSRPLRAADDQTPPETLPSPATTPAHLQKADTAKQLGKFTCHSVMSPFCCPSASPSRSPKHSRRHTRGFPRRGVSPPHEPGLTPPWLPPAPHEDLAQHAARPAGERIARDHESTKGRNRERRGGTLAGTRRPPRVASLVLISCFRPFVLS